VAPDAPSVTVGREPGEESDVLVAATSKNMDFNTTYVFTGVNGGTKVVVSTDVRPKGLVSLLSPLFRRILRRELATKYATVKRIAESPTGPSPG
jgi:hypothetical protein